MLPIINSLLDNDFYKFTMGQAVLHQFPGAEVEYEFKCRSSQVCLLEQSALELVTQINYFSKLRFYADELDFLRSMRFFKNDYIEFLRLYQPCKDFVSVYIEDNELRVKIKGPWAYVIYFEVPILAIISQLHFADVCQHETEIEYKRKYKSSILEVANSFDRLSQIFPNNSIRIADFGTRRRFSLNYHLDVLRSVKDHAFLSGTSNVYMAKKLGLTPIGTMAHEWLQAGQGLGVRLVDSQKFMLENWIKEYRGDLGIALTDVIGVDAFINDFDLYFAKLYDGVRHDSGDPYTFSHKIISMYENLKIDPRTKTIVFSDCLDFERVLNLYNYLKDYINVSFGVGTNLTCNIEGITPLNAVIKMTKCNGQSVAKISDSPGKSICNDVVYRDYLKQVFNVK
jgi:nicotinate phosphoribosyltransferase